MENEHRGSGFAAGFLIGALIGGALALVLAQEDTRDLLVGKAREATDRAKDATADLHDLYERGRTIVENARGNFEAAVDEGKAAAEQARDDLTHHGSEA